MMPAVNGYLDAYKWDALQARSDTGSQLDDSRRRRQPHADDVHGPFVSSPAETRHLAGSERTAALETARRRPAPGDSVQAGGVARTDE